MASGGGQSPQRGGRPGEQGVGHSDTPSLSPPTSTPGWEEAQTPESQGTLVPWNWDLRLSFASLMKKTYSFRTLLVISLSTQNILTTVIIPIFQNVKTMGKSCYSSAFALKIYSD